MKIKPYDVRFWLKTYASKRSLAPLFLLLTCLASCTTYKAPPLPTETPAQWAHQLPASVQAQKADLTAWWTLFNDIQLNQVVAQALTNNLDLAQAKLRITKARMLLGHAGDEFLPELHAHVRTLESIDALDTYFQYGLDASWELGFFGRQSATRNLAQAKNDTVIADAQAIQVSLVAEVVRTYIELRSAQQQIIVLQRQQELDQARVDLFHLRSSLKLSSQQETALIQHDLTQTEIALLKRRQFVDAAAQRLALLLAKTQPDTAWFTPAAQPQFSYVAFDQLPIDLLRTRPEIKTAEAKVLYAVGELGIAQAELYPHISLGSAFLYSANITRNDSLEDAVHSTPGIGPTIDIPLFDWGRRQAAITAQHNQLDEALLAYRQTVIEAVNETEIALSELQLQQQLLKHTADELNIQQQNLKREQILSQTGLHGPLILFETRRNEMQATLDVIEAHASHDLAFIALYKSLGGAPLVTQASLPATGEKTL